MVGRKGVRPEIGTAAGSAALTGIASECCSGSRLQKEVLDVAVMMTCCAAGEVRWDDLLGAAG